MMKPLLDISNLHQAYGSRSIFKNLHLTVQPKHFVWVTGPNGVGKTTLLKTIAGILKPLSGSVNFSFKERASYFSPQSQVYFKMTVDENIHFFSKILGYTVEEAITYAHMLGLQESRGVMYRNLSFGQKIKTLLTLALSQKSSLFLLDEPYTGLDQDSITTLNAVLKNKIEEGASVVCATHQFNPIEGVAIQEFKLC
ncbi:ATP-binding cassette domain-containing protein [bacterium]|nr:ATP-binding cassette domain-containing protein [bacterium]